MSGATGKQLKLNQILAHLSPFLHSIVKNINEHKPKVFTDKKQKRFREIPDNSLLSSETTIFVSNVVSLRCLSP